MMAWMEKDDAPCWSNVAREIVALCLGKFIDSRDGLVREYFAGDWRQASGLDGRIIEPGHQFEWSWLLKKWSVLRGDENASAVASSLFHRGNRGVIPALGVVSGTALDDWTIVEDGARLWPQTERLRAVWAFAKSSEPNSAAGPGFSSEIQQAATVVWRYLDTPVKGLWHERMMSSGSFAGEVSAASSLYHLTGMIAELISDG
jgi:mannose-6-phosphate isomerase